MPDSSERVSLTFYFPPIFDYFFGVNGPLRLKTEEITIRLPILSPEYSVAYFVYCAERFEISIITSSKQT